MTWTGCHDHRRRAVHGDITKASDVARAIAACGENKHPRQRGRLMIEDVPGTIADELGEEDLRGKRHRRDGDLPRGARTLEETRRRGSACASVGAFQQRRRAPSIRRNGQQLVYRARLPIHAGHSRQRAGRAQVLHADERAPDTRSARPAAHAEQEFDALASASPRRGLPGSRRAPVRTSTGVDS